jgi:two-component system chemotaxis response regulator CheB
MKALPVPISEEQTTGVSCPECPGVLRVGRVDGHLKFRCRIGHVLSLQDLLVAKEAGLDAALWACVLALEELAALLRDVAALDLEVPVAELFLEQRAARAAMHADGIREIIEQNESIMFGDIPGQRGVD